MADDFKTYDKSPIVGPVRISKWSFGLREIILAVIAILLLVLVLVFAGLFGKAEKELADVEDATAEAVIGTSFCVSKDCLQTASRAKEFINESVSPCDNFYQFACGNYINARPLGPVRASRNVLGDLYEANEAKLTQIMDQPVQRLTDWAAERKLKEFFHSCNDMYQREKLRGQPFLEKVIQPLGGWALLGTWDEANWDLNTALKKVQTDFWVDALYQPRVKIDYYNQRRRAIEVAPAGVGKFMYYSWYLSPYTEQYRLDYKKFIRRVGDLMLRDSGIDVNDTVKEERLQQFVNDTFEMEYHIAQTAQNSRYTEDPFLEINRVSLSELNTETNNVIDWTGQLSYLLPTAGVTESTKVILLRREYFRNITAVIASLPDADRNRIMHNYLIWRVAEAYVQEMSWEYIHANREIYVDMNGIPNFMGVYRYCFATARSYMPDALSSLYISDFFSEKNRQSVHDITDHLKEVLQTQLDETPWFDQATRNYAKDKLDLITFKMGYPAWMANHDAVDRIYLGVNINVSDFFGNLLRFNHHYQDLWSQELRDGENREQWVFDAFDTNIGVLWSWNEVIASAGLLQMPFYDSAQPHFSTFGSFGAMAARYMHHVIDDWGKHYDKFGNYMGYSESFWSNSSLTKYEADKTCVDNLYVNASREFVLPDGTKFPLRVNTLYNTPRAIAITSGVRLAFKAYNLWAQKQGLAEKMLPGVSLTDQQMVFLSWAQSECKNRDAASAFYFALGGNVDEEVVVNTALGDLKEFADAFRCKPGDKLYHETKCEYF